MEKMTHYAGSVAVRELQLIATLSTSELNNLPGREHLGISPNQPLRKENTKPYGPLTATQSSMTQLITKNIGVGKVLKCVGVKTRDFTGLTLLLLQEREYKT